MVVGVWSRPSRSQESGGAVKVTALAALLVVTFGLVSPAAHAELGHPDLTGSWVALDCVVWWEHGSQPQCDQDGDDASNIRLQIGGGADSPSVFLIDDYSTACVLAGAASPVLLARGTGTYVETGIEITFSQVGCGRLAPGLWEMGYVHWDPQDDLQSKHDDALWWDPDGDGFGHTWYRPSR